MVGKNCSSLPAFSSQRSSNQGLHPGCTTPPSRVSSGCAGPPLPTAPLSYHALSSPSGLDGGSPTHALLQMTSLSPLLTGILVFFQSCLYSPYIWPLLKGIALDCLPGGNICLTFWSTLCGESAHTQTLLRSWTSCKSAWCPHSYRSHSVCQSSVCSQSSVLVHGISFIPDQLASTLGIVGFAYTIISWCVLIIFFTV